MPSTRRALTAGLLAALLAGAGCGGAAAPPTDPTPGSASLQLDDAARGERVIVVLRRGTSATDLDAVLRRHGIRQVRHRYELTITGFAASLPPALWAAVAADPLVAWVAPDVPTQGFGVQVPPPSWGLDRIDQRNTELDGVYAATATGAKVRIYVLDTGLLTTHPDFSKRASIGTDVLRDGQRGIDCDGHGTHVAATAAGTTYGVAKGAQLVGVRVLGCNGFGLDSDAIAGLEWVMKHANLPAVVLMALGTGSLVSPALDAAVTAAIGSGLPVVAAAGNANSNACGVSPAGVPEAITVAATTVSDARYAASNTGTCVDLFAPGKDITSASIFSPGFETRSGTSMAAAHVAGAAALYLEEYPATPPPVLAEALRHSATPGIVSDPGANTPNLLLYSLPAPATPTLSGVSLPGGGTTWRARITVTLDRPVASGIVTGQFSKGGSGACVLEGQATCTITSGTIPASVGSVTFTVDAVRGPGVVLDPAAPRTTTITRP